MFVLLINRINETLLGNPYDILVDIIQIIWWSEKYGVNRWTNISRHKYLVHKGCVVVDGTYCPVNIRFHVLSSKYTFHKGCVVVDATYCPVNIRFLGHHLSFKQDPY